MLPLRHVRLWRWAGAALLVFVLVATLMPAVWLFPDRREFMAWFVDVDKWLHAITFAFLAVWFSGQYRPKSYWRIGLGLVLFGLVIEGCQRLVTYRSAELFDIVADVAGILVGLAIARAGMGGWSLWVEGWLSRRKAGAGIE